MGNGNEWKNRNEYPVYAIPGPAGATLMQQLAWFSGNVTSAASPHTHHQNTSVAPDSQHSENVRLFTFIDLGKLYPRRHVQ